MPPARPESARVRPELDLVLCCARTTSESAHADRVARLCARGLDWSAVLRTAKGHGLVQLVHRHLAALGPGHVPDAVLGQLRLQSDADRLRSLQLAAQLRSILGVLAAAGIPAITYKGPTLALAVYGDIALRRFADLDIIVRREDVLACKGLLLVNGYRPRFSFSRPQEAAYLRSECEYNFDRQRGRVTVEIHWDVAPRSFAFRLDHDRLWRAAQSMVLGGVSVRVPAPEDLLLILAVHGAKHIWERLAWICDIAQFVRTYPALDWAALLSDARARGGERMVLVALCLAGDLLDAPLPDPVRGRLRADPAVATLAGQISDWLARDAIPPAKSGAALRITAAMRERWIDRVRYLVRTTLTPTIDDWAWVRLPSSLFFLHYLLRPLRLAVKYRPGLASS
jgi:hypothetical protein